MKIFTIFTVLALLVSNGYWYVKWLSLNFEIKDGITQIQERDHIITQSIPMLKELMLGMHKEQVLELSERHSVNKQKDIDNCIAVGFHLYKFENNQLASLGTSLNSKTSMCSENL